MDSGETKALRSKRGASLRNFFSRHRSAFPDFSILAAVLFVGLYIVFEFDVYANQDGISNHERTIELDEALTLGGVLSVSLLIFSIRRYKAQEKETIRRIAAERQARELALRDPLTGLANRRQFDQAMAAATAAPPAAGATHAIFLVDLNGFKQVNDVHGHGVGDELLISVGRRLSHAVRDGDLVARLGGDEFAILTQHLLGAEAATNIALRIIKVLEEPISTGSTRHQIGAGIGIALIPEDAETPKEAFRKADIALYRAKAERQSALRFFEAGMDRHVRERDFLQKELRFAIANGAVRAYFQPLVNLSSGNIEGFEVIPRWTHATLGEVAPGRFISVAEESGSIHELSRHLLTQGCRAATQWPSAIHLAFEVFPSQLRDRNLKDRIIAILNDTGLKPSRLEIEITERALVDDLESARDALGALRELGVRISVINFGAGYSTLYHLRNFKLDKLKIDRGFVESLESAQESSKIVSALIGLGHGLGLTVGADGVAGMNQGASLRETGCEQGQGHMFGGPIPVEETLSLFAEESAGRKVGR